MNSSSTWWKRHRSTDPGAPPYPVFPESMVMGDLMDVPALGVSPLGDSQWDCGIALDVEGLRTCTDEMLGYYRDLNLLPGNESGATALMDAAYYVGRDEGSGVRPCQQQATDSSGPPPTSRFVVVVDPQYSDQPACCQMQDMHSEDAAHQFKDGEGAAMYSDNITAYTTGGIRFGRHDTVVYSYLEPTSVPCSEDHKCAVVVEVPGAATIPWLLLQAWCEGCLWDLGTIVLSVDNVDDPTWSFVANQFIPTVQDFLNSRSDVDLDRVYLTSTSKGNEIGMMAAFLHPELFTFALFAGKSFMSEVLEETAVRMPTEGSRLRKISFHVGARDIIHDEDQDYWSRLSDVVKPVQPSVEMELRYYPGGTHAMWYAGWNAYRDLLWTGTKTISDYASSLTMTCKPPAASP